VEREVQIYCILAECDCDKIIEKFKDRDYFNSAYKIDKSDDYEPHLFLFLDGNNNYNFNAVLDEINRHKVTNIRHRENVLLTENRG